MSVLFILVDPFVAACKELRLRSIEIPLDIGESEVDALEYIGNVFEFLEPFGNGLKMFVLFLQSPDYVVDALSH